MHWIKPQDMTPDDGLIVVFRVGEAKIKKLGYYDKRLDVFFLENSPIRFELSQVADWLFENEYER